MFADEQKGNAAKKRAEQNRRRRLQLKEKQNKASAAVKSPPLQAQPVILAAPTPAVSSGTAKLSVVEKASQEREKRIHNEKSKKACSIIQAAARSSKVRVAIRRQICQELTCKLQELAKKITECKKSGQSRQISAITTNSLMRELWFVTSRFSGTSRRPRRLCLDPQTYPLLALLLSCAINPGLGFQDPSMNPLLGLTTSKQGIYQLCSLLRLWLTAMFDPSYPDAFCTNCFAFWKALMICEDNTVKKIATKVMLATRRVTISLKETTTKHQIEANTPLDLIARLRYFMLFQIAGPRPIPTTADTSRESCVPVKLRERCGKIWSLLTSTIDTCPEPNARRLRLRCAIELWTIPLLSWKVSTETVSRWVNNKELLFLQAIDSLVEFEGPAISKGNVDLVLDSPDLSLTLCPVTPAQCLLANLTQLTKISISLNGSVAGSFDYGLATKVWNFLSCVILAVPEATFTSRETSVAWVEVDGVSKPIILSSVVVEQCQGLFVDSFIRKLWKLALVTDTQKVKKIMSIKTDEDEKYEKDFTKMTSASAISMAAQEAGKDRSQSLWKSSDWAKSLSGKVTGMFGNRKNRSTGILPETSQASRKLASGQKRTNEDEDIDPEELKGKSSTRFLFALCRCFAVVLSRWGGALNILEEESTQPTARGELFTISFLNVLCFSTSFLEASWTILQSDVRLVPVLASYVRGEAPIPLFATPIALNLEQEEHPHDALFILLLFLKAMSHSLVVTDDAEIHEMGKPLPMHHLRRLVVTLRKLLHQVCWPATAKSLYQEEQFGNVLVSAIAQTMKNLYDRSSRRPWCAPKLWLVPDLMEKEIAGCKSHKDYVSLLKLPVFRICPFLVSFKRRLKLFERIVTTLRVKLQGENSANPFHSNPLKPGIPIKITRGRILEDGLATMNKLGPNMRERLAIQYYNKAGARESGIDAGGLFKEFWTDLCAVAYNPNYALFSVTDGAGNCLYPNPCSDTAHGGDHTMLFSFLGRILGKAMFEGISISPQFAHFFLSYMRGDYNFLNMLADLSTLDPQLYNNLMFLKTYDGNASDLCLTFTVTNEFLGGNREIPLVLNGESLEVTNENKNRYIELVAKHYVVDSVKDQSQAFTKGLWEVIEKRWLQMFNEPELQVLISGASDGTIDVNDMRSHTRYAGGFTGLDRTVNRFWKVMASLTPDQQASLLRFVTSCERPPPLGFGSLNPPFTIQRVGIMRDGDKLPTASTCFNILKLPTYSSEKVMKQRLLYAIESGTGFELS